MLQSKKKQRTRPMMGACSLLLLRVFTSAHHPTDSIANSPPSANCSSAAFPQNRSGIQCHGLHADPAGNASASACLQRCCDSTEGCGIWQYASFGTERCWVGLAPTDCRGQPGPWKGGQRSAPPTPPLPPTPAPPPITPGAKRGVVFKSKDCSMSALFTQILLSISIFSVILCYRY